MGPALGKRFSRGERADTVFTRGLAGIGLGITWRRFR